MSSEFKSRLTTFSNFIIFQLSNFVTFKSTKKYMKIIDWYILKRFIMTFLFTLLILLPITVAIDVAEKIDKFLNNDYLTFEILVNDYYKNFIIYFGNTFMPLALFLAVIIFTSRLSNNTEVIAINNAQVSFTRFLYPYFLGATMITIFALVMNHYIVPNSSKQVKIFEKKYLGKHKTSDYIRDFSLQLNDSTYIYLKSFDISENSGYRFSIDEYKGLELKSKLRARRIRWIEKDSTFKLIDWNKRIISKHQDILSSGDEKDTTFTFSPKDFAYKDVMAVEMQTPELKRFINISKARGVKNLNVYWVEVYKRTSLPIATYILTMIAVGLSYRKRRGGIGINLALGITIMFAYVFFLRVAEVLGAVAEANSLINVWMPNIIFGGYAIYLYLNARK